MKNCRCGLNYGGLLKRLMAEMANRATGFRRGRCMVVPNRPGRHRHDQENGQSGDKDSQPSFPVQQHVCKRTAEREAHYR
jgi:hypothetical protein